MTSVATYNPSGSNTLASGAGPATALTGTNAVPTGQVIALDGSPDLSGVSEDDLIYFESTDDAGNRRLFPIESVDDGADTVTIPAGLTIVGTGVNWAIGGKRVDYENSARKDWMDMLAGWRFEHEAGTYTQPTDMELSGLGDFVEGGPTLQAAPGVALGDVIFDQTTTHDMFSFANDSTGGVVSLIGIKFTRSSGSGVSSFFKMVSSNTLYIKNCDLDCTGMDIGVELRSTANCILEDTIVRDSDDQGVYATAGRPSLVMRRCSVRNNATEGIRLGGASTHQAYAILDCYIYRNGTGIMFGPSGTSSDRYMATIQGNTIVFNRGAGILGTDATPSVSCALNFVRNVITNNVGYGIDLTSQLAKCVAINQGNNYFSNTSGARNNLAVGDDDTAVDPKFVNTDVDTEDFSLQATSALVDSLAQGTN